MPQTSNPHPLLRGGVLDRINRIFFRRTPLILFIIFVAASLRLWGLGQADFVSDESLNSFRAVGMVDFLSTEFQTTPWEWVDSLPWWMRLSFHDHPPLSFLLQHLFFTYFGVHNTVARMPSALAGIASVWLVYLLLARLHDTRSGIVAAAIMAVGSFPLWISRVALQESLVIVFVIVTLYCMTRACSHPRWWYGVGLTFGFGMLTKYTVIFLVPVIFLYHLVAPRIDSKPVPPRLPARHPYCPKEFWRGWGIAFFLFTPVLVYNWELYRHFGHFDLQFSYLFDQFVPAWQQLPGKSDAGFFANIKGIITTLRLSLSPTMFWLFLLSLAGGIHLSRSRRHWHALTLIAFHFIFITLLLGFIGSDVRFLVMLTPFIAILIAVVIMAYYDVLRHTFFRFGVVCVGMLLILGELLFTINSNFVVHPIGPAGITFTPRAREHREYSFQSLDDYFTHTFDTRVTTLLLQAKSPVLHRIAARHLADRKHRARLPPMQALVIVDMNIDWYARVWYLHRRALYDGLPVITADDYLSIIQTHGADFYTRAGFHDFYFIYAGETLRSSSNISSAASTLRTILSAQEVRVLPIHNALGGVAFTVYEF